MNKLKRPPRVKPRNHHAAALRFPALRPKVIESKKLYTRKGRRR